MIRPRLLDAVDAGVGGSFLTLVSAPAAAGKTVLLSTWQREREPDAVWLDSRATTQAPFWARVADAIQVAAGPRLYDLDIPPGDGSVGFVDHLIDCVGDLERPLVLVLDDLQSVSEYVLRDLDRLLRAAPASLRLVVGTRVDPPLSLHLLRLTDDLAEIRARDLAFTTDEAGRLFDSMGLAVDDEALASIVERTEGWIGGLRLIGFSLRRRHRDIVSELEIDERPIADYLAAEVLASNEATRPFLLRTSIFDTLDGPLVDVVLGRSDGERVLSALYRDNVFIDRLDGEARRYRYSALFLELLRAEARAELGEELLPLHERAARALAERDQPIPAIRHAIDARRWGQVSEVIARFWVTIYAECDPESTTRLLARVPREYALRSSAIAAFSALVRLSSGDARRAAAFLSDDGPAGDQALSLRRYAHILAAYSRGDLARVATLAEAQLDCAAVEASNSIDEDRRRALALAALGSVRAWDGAFDEARADLEEAVDLAHASGAAIAEIEALAHLAFIELVDGRLRRAARTARAALYLADVHRLADRPCTTIAYVALGLVEHQWGDLDAAARAVKRADTIARVTGNVPGRTLAAVAIAVVASSRGGDEAEEALIHLRAACRRMPVKSRGALGGRIAALEIRLLAASGRGEEAAALGGDHNGDPYVAVALARLRLASDAPALALAALAGREHGSTPAEIEARVVAAVALRTLARDAEAADALASALELAEPETIRRAFIDAGAPLRELLVHHLRRSNRHRWLATELVQLLDGHGDNAVEPVELLEPLSIRETEVLRYLPTAMSNAEIAAEFFVSVNTVKTHVKSIYRKLGAAKRQEAVRRARQLRLL